MVSSWGSQRWDGLGVACVEGLGFRILLGILQHSKEGTKPSFTSCSNAPWIERLGTLLGMILGTGLESLIIGTPYPESPIPLN